MRLFGLETEYGIQVDGVGEEVDVVLESMELVRCYLREDFVARWNYAAENPRRDLRGFEVAQLLNDQDEAAQLQRDRQRSLSLAELKSDLTLTNGARFYNDHTHPEYSTPECCRLRDLLVHERAGEHILRHCARRHTATRGRGVVRLYKNNTDFCGHSYGCHENYLIRREIPFAEVVAGLVPFLVTRQVFAGAGKVGVEGESPGPAAIFQLSQRADFFESLVGVDTMIRRPLVNTRDEPHADPRRFRRLHLILGDANMSEYAAALKVGTTLLVLDLLDEGLLPGLALADPVRAFRDISRDQGRTWAVPLAGGRQTTALEIQAAHLEQARRYLAGRDGETDWVLAEWQAALATLAQEPTGLVGRSDWATKKWLLDAFAASERLDWENPEDRVWLQSQDLEYHNLEPEEGLFRLLEAQGQALRLTHEEDVMRALVEPPADTRAYFRGRCLERFGEAVRTLNWDFLEFRVDGQVRSVDLKGWVDESTAACYNQLLDQARSLDELFRLLPAAG